MSISNLWTQRIFLYSGVILILCSLPALFFATTRFLYSYLFAYLFWLELTLGAMSMLMIYPLTYGGWGAVTRRILEAANKTIYLMAVLFTPILVGFPKIYSWANLVKFDLEKFAHKKVYFNYLFFSVRSIFYLISWLILAYILEHWLNGNKTGVKDKRTAKFSAFGLVFIGLSVTWAAIDWQMSLDPTWRSTMYGFIFIIGQAFGAWAFTLLVYNIILKFYTNIYFSKKIELDLANILLTLVILWAYVSFMQYLIIWSGNLPDEVSWFFERMSNGWQYLMLLLYCFLFASPFLVLLFRNLKTNRVAMIALLLIILMFRILERYWMIMPSLKPFSFSYTDITLLLGLGALWISLFLRNLASAPLFATNDPNWPQDEKVLSHGEFAA